MSRQGIYDEKYGFIPDNDCPQEKPKMTNADRIRAMSAEDMANRIVSKFIMDSYCCPPRLFASEATCVWTSCVDCWTDWLKQEAEDG